MFKNGYFPGVAIWDPSAPRGEAEHASNIVITLGVQALPLASTQRINFTGVRTQRHSVDSEECAAVKFWMYNDLPRVPNCAKKSAMRHEA